jgi:hypothetical protein
MRYVFKLLVWVILLMSGILSLVREVYGMYYGVLPPPNLFWSCVRIAFGISALILIWQQVTAKRKIEQRLVAIEEARPRIILKQPRAVYVENAVRITGSSAQFVAPFLKVRFVNEPAGPYPNAKVDGVKATIQYFRDGEDTPLLEIDGRWSGSDQPSLRDYRQSRTDLLRMAFDIGDVHELDVAYRDPRTGCCYAWNNDNYNYSDMTKPEHGLDGGAFRVKVRLLGIWVDQTFVFGFTNSAKGLEIV